MKSFKDLREKTLTAAEKKKREEIAKAMERDNPGMDMKKKMAIATATAKRVAEESDDRDELTKKLFPKKSPKEMEKADKERNRKMNQKKFMKPGKPSRSREWGVYEEVELEEGIENMSHARLKWHMNTGVPHGSYTKAEMKAERDRRLSKVDTHAAYKKAKPSMNEEADSSMCCKHCGDEFGKPTNEKCMYDAYDPSGKNWVKKESYNEALEDKVYKNGTMKKRGYDEVDEISMSDLSNKIANSTGTKNIKTAMKPGEVKKGLDDLRKRLATLGDPKLTKEAYEEAQLDEISKKTLGSYVKKASADVANRSADNARDYATGNRPAGANKKAMKNMKRTQYVNKAVDKLTQEETQIDEVLDTPKAMDSYRNKAKYSKDRAANSAAAKMLRDPKGFHSTDTSDELKTMDKRAKGLKMADRAAKRKTFKKLRNETVMSADKKPEKYVKPDGTIGIRMVRVDKNVVDKDA